MKKYTEEQKTVIDAMLREQKEQSDVCYLESDEIQNRNCKTYALFKSFGRAFELEHNIENTKEYNIEFVPVIIDGRAFLQSPDEGIIGVLHLYRVIRRDEKIIENPVWKAEYIPCSSMKLIVYYRKHFGITHFENVEYTLTGDASVTDDGTQYKACAVDANNNEFHVFFDILDVDNFDKLEDQSEACDWRIAADVCPL